MIHYRLHSKSYMSGMCRASISSILHKTSSMLKVLFRDNLSVAYVLYTGMTVAWTVRMGLLITCDDYDGDDDCKNDDADYNDQQI